MIELISQWAEGIIIAVVIATLLEMIIPEGNNKKYIKVIIGIYILFTIISPIINKFSKFDISISTDIYDEYFKEDEMYQSMSEEFSNTSNSNINNVFLSNLKTDIIEKVNKKGYKVLNININVELNKQEEYGKIRNIKLSVQAESKKEVENAIAINKVEIGNTVNNTKNDISKKEIDELKEYISKEYETDISNIEINS